MNDVIEIFNQSQKSLVLQTSDLSLKSISDMVDDGNIDVMPRYQRRERWTQRANSELIESFLLNIPVPPIYLSEDEYGTYSVIDGKQRLLAINGFLNGNYALSGLERFTGLEGAKFDDLPFLITNALKIRPYLRVVTLLRQSDPELKHEVFLRLNKGGIALNSQEIRNVAFRGEYNELLLELSGHEYFSKQIGAKIGSKIFSEMLDIQFVLRFFTLREMYCNFPGNMDKAMDSYMREHYRDGVAKIMKDRELFIRSLDFCREVWGDYSFKRPEGTSKAVQGYYDIHMVPVSLVSDKTMKKILADKNRFKSELENLLETNEELNEAVSQFTSNAKNVKIRVSVVKDLLETFK